MADYIPQLARSNPSNWAISICTVDGQRRSWGNSSLSFTLQSVCKPFTYAIALEELGADEVCLDYKIIPWLQLEANCTFHVLRRVLRNQGYRPLSFLQHMHLIYESWRQLQLFFEYMSIVENEFLIEFSYPEAVIRLSGTLRLGNRSKIWDWMISHRWQRWKFPRVPAC